MTTKRVSYPGELVEFKALNDDLGQVEALVSIFGNVDFQNDRVMPGAFADSIAKWEKSGDQVPVVFSHDWSDVFSHIGVVDSLEETDKGLKAVYTLDIADNPVARQVYRLMKRRTLKEHSFAYDVQKEKKADDGVNELHQLDVIEVGPTLKGANPDTELLAVKALVEVQEKAGRAISTKNETLLRTAYESLGKILESLGEPDEAEASDGKVSVPTNLDVQLRVLETEQTING